MKRIFKELSLFFCRYFYSVFTLVWFEFGVFGVFKADELPLYRDELKKYGQKCTAVYFNKTEKEMFPILKKR